MISLASDFSVAAGMLDIDSACAFQSRAVCFLRKAPPPPAMVEFFMFWMSKKETRHFKLLTVAEILDDKEGEGRSGTWASRPGCCLNV